MIKKQEGDFMKIGKFFKFVIKTLAAAIAIGSIAYIVKDIMDKKASDNFDDTWDDDLDEDFSICLMTRILKMSPALANM